MYTYIGIQVITVINKKGSIMTFINKLLEDMLTLYRYIMSRVVILYIQSAM